MYRILVAVDGSERADRAAQFAVDLAQRMPEVELLLLNAQEAVDESQTHGLGRDAIIKHREVLASATATQARALIQRAGLSCTFEWHFGEPAQVIADFANSQHCNLIVMGTQGAGAAQNLILGSVAQSVLHLASVPVALVKCERPDTESTRSR